MTKRCQQQISFQISVTEIKLRFRLEIFLNCHQHQFVNLTLLSSTKGPREISTPSGVAIIKNIFQVFILMHHKSR